MLMKTNARKKKKKKGNPMQYAGAYVNVEGSKSNSRWRFIQVLPPVLGLLSTISVEEMVSVKSEKLKRFPI